MRVPREVTVTGFSATPSSAKATCHGWFVRDGAMFTALGMKRTDSFCPGL